VGELLDYAEAMPGVMHLVQPDAVDPLKLMSINTKTTRKNRHMFCLFCKPSTAILDRNKLEYTNLNLLTSFLNERGMIIQRDESRLCMKHQRAVARTIKRARSIGLLSPLSNWRVPHEYVYGREGAGAGATGGGASGGRADIVAGGAAGLRSQRGRADFGASGASGSGAGAEPVSDDAELLKREEEAFANRSEPASRRA
jgi:ribosomal protein S18